MTADELEGPTLDPPRCISAWCALAPLSPRWDIFSGRPPHDPRCPVHGEAARAAASDTPTEGEQT